jgi:hypothetical protein
MSTNVDLMLTRLSHTVHPDGMLIFILKKLSEKKSKNIKKYIERIGRVIFDISTFHYFEYIFA